jgi:L-rhamnose mutarotase
MKSSKATEWFNKMRQSFQEKLDPTEKEKYKKLGEQFYQTFEDDQQKSGSSSNDIFMEEAVAYVVESLKSGIHPSYLTEDEKVLMQAAYGEEWFLQWGWTHNDLKINNK